MASHLLLKTTTYSQKRMMELPFCFKVQKTQAVQLRALFQSTNKQFSQINLVTAMQNSIGSYDLLHPTLF